NEWLGVYERIIRCCKENGVAPNVVGNPMNMRHLVTTISSGLGISIAPRCIKFIADDSCVCRPINQIDIQLPLTAYFRKHNKNRIVDEFISHTITESTKIQTML
ncbi:LysR substrate-binding domain-containing protein, partial [Vibrio sp. F13]